MFRAGWSHSTIWGWVICAALLGGLAFIRHDLAIDHDEGLLGQAAERVLQGQWPHRDFDDTYTGGQAFFHAAVFRLLGTKSAALRDALWLAAALFTVLFFTASVFYFGSRVATVLTTLAFVWSFPTYFAPLPSWYNLIFAVASWYFLTVGRRWGSYWPLGVAGLFCGLSVLFKVVGLFSFGAGLLAIVYTDQVRNRPGSTPVPPGPSQNFDSGPLRWGVALLVLLAGVGPLVVLHRSLTWTNVFYFWAPIVAVTIPLVLAENRLHTRSWQVRANQLGREMTTFVLGFAFPLVAWCVAYARWEGGLAQLFRGVFVLPQSRVGLAENPLPPLPILLLSGLPLIATLVWVGTRYPRRWQVVGLGLFATLLVWFSFPGNWAFKIVENGCSLLAPVGVVWAAWRVRLGAPVGRETELFSLAAAVGLFNLTQYPFATYLYRAYTFPLVLLLWAVLLLRSDGTLDDGEVATPGVGKGARRAALAVVAIFAYLYTVKWHHSSSLFSAGWHSAKRIELAELLPERVGLNLPKRDQLLFARIAEVVDRLVPSGQPILALPDAPQIYFFCDRPNPTRHFYDALAAKPLSRESLGPLLERVGLVVVNHEPAFSPPLDPSWVKQIEEVFPERWQAGPYDVYYRRR